MAMPLAISMPAPRPWTPRKTMSCVIASAPAKIAFSHGSPAAPESAEPATNSRMPPR